MHGMEYGHSPVGISASELPELHQKAIDLLDLLQKNLPDKTGEKAKWNFEKAHSILHKVSEIVLWGNLDNTSCQAPEVEYMVYTLHTCMYMVHTSMLYVCTLHLYVCTVCIDVYTCIYCVYTCIIYVCTYLF